MAETTASKRKVEKTEAEWRELLTPEQFHVMREKGTERPFSGALVDNHDDGMYHCAGMRRAAVYLGQEVRVGSRLAKLLAAGDPGCRLRRTRTSLSGCGGLR